jgi:hypothetical protein
MPCHTDRPFPEVPQEMPGTGRPANILREGDTTLKKKTAGPGRTNPDPAVFGFLCLVAGNIHPFRRRVPPFGSTFSASVSGKNGEPVPEESPSHLQATGKPSTGNAAGVCYIWHWPA